MYITFSRSSCSKLLKKVLVTLKLYEINPNFVLNVSSGSGKMISVLYMAIETCISSCCPPSFTNVCLNGCQ